MIEFTTPIKQVRIDDTLAFLNEYKKRCDDGKRLPSIKNLITKHHLSTTVAAAAIRLGFFTIPYKNAITICNKKNFEPIDARKVYLLSREIYRNNDDTLENKEELVQDPLEKFKMADLVFDDKKPKEEKIITQKKLERVWAKMENSEKRLARLATAISQTKPILEDNKIIHFEVVNELQMDWINKNCKTRLLSFLREKLGNQNIELNVRVSPIKEKEIINRSSEPFTYVSPRILDNFTTEELINEIKKRGGSGEINFTTKFTL